MNDRTEWLQWRREGIGASDVAGILRLSPWTSPYRVWADKVGLLPTTDDSESERLRFGHMAEPMIAEYVRADLGLVVAGEQTWCSRPDKPWHRATVDGFIFESDRTDSIEQALGVLEVKTDFGTPWDEVPAYYQAQVQWQMHVTGMMRALVAALFGFRFRPYWVERDQRDIDMIVGEVDRFWHDHVLAGVPPELDGSEATLETLAAIYPAHVDGKSVELDDIEWKVGEWQGAKLATKDAKAREDRWRAEIEAALGDAEIGTINGRKAVSWKTQTRAAYTVAESTSRVLRAHTAKEKKAS